MTDTTTSADDQGLESGQGGTISAGSTDARSDPRHEDDALATKRQPHQPSPAARIDPARAAQLATSIGKRFLKVGDVYFDRSPRSLEAFRDENAHIRTRREEESVVSGMLDLAATKGWATVRVEGSTRFRQLVWMQASIRGMQVEGYTPTELDRMRLAEQRAEEAPEKATAPAPGLPRERPVTPGARRTTHPVSEDDEPGPVLSEAEKGNLAKLREMMERDGAAPTVIARALKATEEGFTRDRFYVGILKEHGEAPFQHQKGNRPSAYAVLDTPVGERTIWGVDLPRAIDEARVGPGVAITLAYQGFRNVEVAVPTIDSATGEKTGSTTKVVKRNSWHVERLRALTEQQREEAMARAQATATSEALGSRPQTRAARERQKPATSAPAARRVLDDEPHRSRA